MSDEEEESNSSSLHGPNCECSDRDSEDNDSEDDDDDEPQAKRQKRCPSSPAEAEASDIVIIPGGEGGGGPSSGRFSPGDYLYLSSSDDEKIVEAVERAELARKLQERSDSVSDWGEEEDDVDDGTAASQQGPLTTSEISDQEDESDNQSPVRTGQRTRESPAPIDGDFCDNSSSMSSLESYEDPDIEIDSGSNTWMISSPLNGSGSSVHWSNSPPLHDGNAADGNPDDRVYDLEFEVASVSESELNQNPIEDANSSSGLDERVDVNLPLLPDVGESLLEDEKDRDADNSAEDDSESSIKSEKSEKHGLSSDSELSEKDKWPCHQCKTMTCAISRYCLRCFRTRRNWLPKRPKSRKAKAKRRTNTNNVMVPHSTDNSIEEEQGQSHHNYNVVNHHRTLSDRASTQVIASALVNSSSSQVGAGGNSASSKPFVLLTDIYDPTMPSSASPAVTTTPPASSFQDNTPPTSNPNSQLSLSSHSSSDSSLLKVDNFITPKSMLQLNTKLNTINSSSQLTKDGNLLRGSLESVNNSNDSSNIISNNNSLQEEELSEEPQPSPSSTITIASSSPRPHSTKKSNIILPETPMCTVCCLREKDAAFVHNKIAHHCCCFSCADKILKKTGKCPICRERILRVVKIISV